MQIHDTPPDAVAEHWQFLTRDPDPLVRAAARELLADLKLLRRPKVASEERPPAAWRSVIDQVIVQEPRSAVSTRSFKTGHGHQHASRSGTCVSVDMTRGVWYCASCRRGGTCLTWVMEIEQCSFGEAWQILVDRFGVAHA